MVSILAFNVALGQLKAPGNQKSTAKSGSIATKESKSIRIAVVGDSLSEGYGVKKEEAYPIVLGELLKGYGKQVDIINASISGSTTASAARRLQWQLKKKPDYLLLALGANDGLRGFDLNATKENLQKTIKLAQKHGVTVILAGVRLPMNYGADYRKKFEAVFKDLANDSRVIFIPFLLQNVGGVKELNQSDGIHPNAAGHQIMAKTVFEVIKDKL